MTGISPWGGVGELNLHGEDSHLLIVTEESLDAYPHLACRCTGRQDDTEDFFRDGTVKPRDNEKIIEISVGFVGG